MVWGAFLLFLGGWSDVPAVETDLPLDKAAHFLLYGLLGWLTARGWVALRRPAWYWPLFFALLVGAVDELHQRTVPGRSADLLDYITDVAAVGIAYTLRSRAMGGRLRSPG
jgi:VanZ family protein